MPLARITLRQLEAFSAVAESLGFKAAGQRLGLSASAVSQLVAELEATLGFRLFDRSTRRVALSAAGRDYRASVESVLRQLALADSAAADLRNRSAGIARIGAPLALAGAALPSAVLAFREQRPRAVVRIRDVDVEEMLERLSAGDLDLALGPDRVTGPDIVSVPVFTSPWVLWCSADHPLAARESVVWDDLREVALVAAGRDHEQSVARMRSAAPVGSRIVPVDVVDNITTALGIAAAGLAATLSPAYVGVIARPLGLVMKRVLKPEVRRQVCLYRSRVRALPPVAEALAAFLADWLRRWQESQRRQRSPQPRGATQHAPRRARAMPPVPSPRAAAKKARRAGQ